ncbi:MAG: C4-dicarboxylate ABC transporter permease [Desulfitibacter sp. BRH_c19]|nr:MAG: C4-dicarboxylate ABC transporter permease [Desulfitibacter sp. BRH_c19]
MGLVLFSSLFIFLFSGIPIAIALSTAALLGVLLTDTTVPLIVVSQRMFTSIDSFPFMAAPFFILAGNLMEKGGISKRLIKFCQSILGFLSSSLGIITIVASAFFGAISGSNVATVAAIGGIMIPAMVKAGYPKNLSAAISASSGTLGVVIPPSIPMVTYGITASVSIGRLFLAGFIPGLLLAGVISVCVLFLARGCEEKEEVHSFEFKDLLLSFKDAIWAILMPIIILGGIYGGVFTPTEAAAVAAVYALIVSVFIYKEIEMKDLKPVFINSAVTSSVILFIVSCSAPFAWLMTNASVPEAVSSAILAMFDNKYIILLLLNFILLTLGMFMETQSIILLMTPILIPLALSLGIDLTALGIIIVVNTSIGMITPPLAVNLFVASSISKSTIEQVSKSVMPFLIAEVAIVLLITFYPGIITWLPDLLGK